MILSEGMDLEEGLGENEAVSIPTSTAKFGRKLTVVEMGGGLSIYRWWAKHNTI